LPLYGVSRGSEGGDETLLWHDRPFKKGEWHAMVEGALRHGNLSRESVADYLCREHGFVVIEPRFGVHLDGVVECGGNVMIPARDSYTRSSAEYVSVWSEVSELMPSYWRYPKNRVVVSSTPKGELAQMLCAAKR
jgi:hypothetical protein